MLQILRLARRDGDEWVRLFASVLAPFPNNQTINSDQITEGTLEDLQDKITEACGFKRVGGGHWGGGEERVVEGTEREVNVAYCYNIINC